MPQVSGLLPGARLGPYEIVAPIGAGGMGEVYRARDSRLGRDVAIKVLPATMSADPDRLRRFELEARAAAALNHPGILAVFDIGAEGGAPYIVSELLEGETLRARLGRAHQAGDTASGSGAIPVRKAVDYALQIARGLSAAHERGIVHRDLKPENLFVTADGRVKILDFGLAKLAEPTVNRVSDETIVPHTRATDAGTVLGTMGYMSPEQLRAQAVDHRADIFGFGAVLYEMLSGQRAFRGETPADTISAILDKDPPELSSIGPRIPPALARVVDRCLEKSPTARFQSTHDLAFALEGLSGVSDTATTSSVATAARSTSPSGRREMLAWTVAGFLLLALGGGGAVLYRRPPSTATPLLRFSIHPPSGVTLATGPIAVAPDGTRFVYAARRGADEPQMLFLQSLDEFDGRPLPGTVSGGEPFWSPDGTRIGFVAEGRLLKTLNVDGGAVQTVANVPDGSLGASWGEDDVILVGTLSDGLTRLSAAGGPAGTATQLDRQQHEESHRRPTFLPDGRHFTYVAQPGNHVYVGSLDSAERTQLLDAESQAVYSSGHLLFARQGSLFAQPFDLDTLALSGTPLAIAQQVIVNPVAPSAAFSVSGNGSLVYETGVNRGNATIPMQLTWFDRSGKTLGTASDVSDYRSIELSPDGRRLAEHHHNLESGGDIWLRDLARGGTTRLTFGGHNTEAVWSPDGSRVIYSSNLPPSGKAPQDISAGPFNLFLKRSDGGGEASEVLDSVASDIPSGWKQPTSWSADGQVVLFDLIDPKTAHDIWMLPLAGDRKPRPWLQTEFREMSAQLSPEGRWVAYQSNETRRFEIYVRPLSGSEKVLISTAGGAFARWRADGKELYYISLDNKLMAVPIRVTGTSIEAGAPHALFEAHVAFPGGGVTTRGNTPFPYAVSMDGQRFLVSVDVTPPAQTPPISVVLNWTEGLKR